MFTSRDLKSVITEVRPIVERQLDDATLIASFRENVTAKGGDWSQVKALVKAMIQDERDEAGGHKRVLAILHKADNALGYADMLGLGNLNEKNSFEPEHDAETGEVIEREVPATVAAAGASPALTSIAAAEAANANVEAEDVVPPPAHAPEQPGTDHGSVNVPAEGSADSAAIRRMSMTPLEPREAGGLKGFGFTVRFDEPETIPPVADPATVVSEAANGDSAPSLAAIPVADRSKPNPICRDPGDCGVYASWAMPCQACKAAAAHRSAA